MTETRSPLSPEARASRRNPKTSSARSAGLIRSIAGALLVWAADATLLALALGGLRALSRHTPALALLLVWLIGGLVLSVSRPVRRHRPVASGGEPPFMLLVLLLLPLLAPPIAALGEHMGWLAWRPVPALAWTGVGLAAFGFALRLAAMLQLGSRFSPLVVVQEEHRLETTGVYARVRHPGYLGAWLACAGSALVFASAVAWPLVALFAAALMARIRREESLLEQHFGDSWRAYCARTGALVPRI